MATKDNKGGKSSDKGSSKVPNPNRQSGYIGENKGDFGSQKKGAELIPPQKPKKK